MQLLSIYRPVKGVQAVTDQFLNGTQLGQLNLRKLFLPAQSVPNRRGLGMRYRLGSPSAIPHLSS